MNDQDKDTWQIGEAKIYAERNLPNPIVVGSYQGVSELYKFINNLKAENKKLREALIECPIVGEIHRDSNERFKEWNLIHRNTIKEALKESST